MKFFFGLCFLYLCLFVVYADYYNDAQRIRKTVLKNYDKTALPQKYKNGTTFVYLLLFPRAFRLNDEKEEFTMDALTLFFWRDRRIKWDYKSFGKIRYTYFADNELWKPDITVYNNAEISEVDHYGNTHFIGNFRGGIWWFPPARTITFCKINLKYWPYDTQTCNISLGSWSTVGSEVNLRHFINTTKVFMSRYSNTSSSWKFIKGTQHRIIRDYGYNEVLHELVYSFILKRFSPAFASVIVVPATMIPFLLLVIFVLPVDHKYRLLIGLFCVFSNLAEIFFIDSYVPGIGSSVPFILYYYSVSFTISVLITVLCAFLGRLCHKQDPLLSFPPGTFVKVILTGPLATILCLREHANKVGLSSKVSEDGEVLDMSKPPSFYHEWLLVAKTIDRIAMIVLIFVYIVCLIAYV